ncbi:hypothetical protein OQA88_13263 [Cercophora sp. LCS_1]
MSTIKPSSYTPEELALLPHDSLGPTLLATSWSLTALATLFLGLRGYCKISRHRGLWWDDWVLVAAWVTLVVDVAVATHLVVDYTYGHHTWDFRAPDIDRFFLVVNVRATLTVTAIAWTKTAFALTMLRLTDGWIKTALWFIIITMNIALGITALLFWIPCTPVQKSWTPTIQEGSCWDPTIVIHYNIFSGAYSAAVDFTLALLPWKLLLNLQMKRTEKFGAAIALSMGLVAGISAVVKTAKLPNLTTNDVYDAADLVIWDITEPAVSMVGACIPVLRVLVRDMRSTGRRYSKTEDPSDLPDPTWPGWKIDGLASNSSPSSANGVREADDNGSEKSILQAPPVQDGHTTTLHTQKVTVESKPRERGDHVIDYDCGYELGTIRSR